MIDFVKISVKAGDGGDGHVSFIRQKGKPFGLADGGDGGDGSDVFIVPSTNLSTLSEYRFRKIFQADKGGYGGRNNKTGAKGRDLLLEVPLGTLVKDDKGQEIFDITHLSEKIMIAKGGKGGRGNIHLRHEIKRRKELGEKGLIKVFEPGSPGEAYNITLELKVLADVGLVGLPNAGKSTLISKLTAARPKIANYPFTTLEPNLGVMTYKGKEIVLADVPGLIEGASQGKGLGDQFLRHLERTRLLVHLVALDSESALDDFKTIEKELSSYSEKFTSLKTIVCLTKSDLVETETVKKVTAQFKKEKLKPFVISSLTEVGLDKLKDEILKNF